MSQFDSGLGYNAIRQKLNKNKAVMKQVLKDLVIVTWWAIRLYTKRFYNVISYGLNYRKMIQSSYLSIQHSRSLCIYAFYKKPEEA